MQWKGKAGIRKLSRYVSNTTVRNSHSTNKGICTGIFLLFLVCMSAHASLISRLSGQAYYDDVLNITWVADANLSQTLGYDADGLMRWSDANAWIASLNSANYLGVTGWRLPSADINGENTIVNCATASELTCRDNEMGYMYWYNLVNYGSPAPFSNVGEGLYWSNTEYALDTSRVWVLNFEPGTGTQGADVKTSEDFSWAVLNGDIANAVPVPGAVWLLGSALGVLGCARKSIRSKV